MTFLLMIKLRGCLHLLKSGALPVAWYYRLSLLEGIPVQETHWVDQYCLLIVEIDHQNLTEDQKMKRMD